MRGPVFFIAGGGTGGHIFPALAIGEALTELCPEAQVFYVGTRYGMEGRILGERGLPLLTLPMRGFLGKGLLQRLALLWRIPASLLRAWALILGKRPSAVVGVGGYASLPLVAAAVICRIPCMLQEQNAVPGLANRLLSRWAKLACLGMPEPQQHLKCRCMVTGNPIRRAFRQLPPWSPARRQILILGGSQGSAALNRTLPKVLAGLELDGYSLLHQCGAAHLTSVRAAYQEAGIPCEVVSFIEDMPSCLANSLLVISRAGASTIAELEAAAVPAILVPLPKATHDHQMANARSLAERGAARIVPEGDLDQCGELLACLLANPRQLTEMSQAHRVHQTPAATRCAQLLFSLQRPARRKDVSRVSQN